MVTRNPVKGEQGNEMMIIYHDERAVPIYRLCSFFNIVQSTIVNKKYGKKFLTLCSAGADCTGAKVQGKQVRLKLQPCLPNGQGSWFLLYGSFSQHSNAL